MRIKDYSTQSALYLTEKLIYLIAGLKIQTHRSSNKCVLLTSSGWCQYILDSRGKNCYQGTERTGVGPHALKTFII